jgi:hypothetical protein
VEVFEHEVLYTLPTDYQDHRFCSVYRHDSRIPPYVGDIDNDGLPEILVAADITNISGAAGTPQIYLIVEWDPDRGIVETGQIAAQGALRRYGHVLKPL